MKTLEDYKKKIRKAKTKEELHQISYEAFLADTKCTIDVMAKEIGRRSRSLYGRVVTLCVKRQNELGL